MAGKYKNPPVIEAWVELHFEYGEEVPEWNKKVADDFIESLNEPVANKEYIVTQSVTVNPKQKSVEIKSELERIKAYIKENDRCIQVGRQVFVYNLLKRDTEWPGFSVLLQEALLRSQQYMDRFFPKRIKQAVLHYKDNVVIPFEESGKIDPKDYFEMYPHMPQKIGDMAGYSLSLNLPNICQDGVMQFSVMTNPCDPEKSQSKVSFIIDWDVQSTNSFDCQENISCEKWFKSAHDGVLNAFEMCLTEKCKKIFS